MSKLWMVLVFALVPALLPLGGCAPGSQAAKGAGEGAKYGAVGGAVAGAVSSLIFGGNVVQGAVAGGLTGAASGAAVGGMAGSAADKRAEEQRAAAAAQAESQGAALRKRIGDQNYASVLLLAQCQHQNAIASTEQTFASSQDPKIRSYALMIEALAAEDSGDKALASSIYPRILKEDPSRGSVDKLRADVLEGLFKVQAARREHGLPPTCT